MLHISCSVMSIAGYLALFCICYTNVDAGLKHYDRSKPYTPPSSGGKCRFNNLTINANQMTPGELCKRPCDGRPRICHFTFYIEDYTTMGLACGDCPNTLSDCFAPDCVAANGYPRSIVTVNRKIPGTCIEVCQHDTIVVDVINLLHAATTTIHWHGIRQTGIDQYFDGVPYITQCPISPGNKFRYTFQTPDCGSFWYHSHSGMQRPDGCLGCFNVRCNREPLARMYDTDNATIMLIDWTLVPAGNLISGFTLDKKNLVPDTVLINGRSSFYNQDSDTAMPITIIDVEAGKRARIRLIGSTSYTCSYMVQFQSHPVTLITIDGGLRVRPVRCDTVIINSAERFDVVLTANQSSNQLYYILIQGTDGCSLVTSYAILRYLPSSIPLDYKEIDLKSKSLFPIQRNITCNAVNSTCAPTRSDIEKKNDICIGDLDGVCTPPIDIRNKTMCPNSKTYIFDVGFKAVSRDDVLNRKFEKFLMPGGASAFLPLINNIVFASPPTTLLGSAKYNPANTFCNATCLNRSIDNELPCECTAVYPISFKSCVTLIIRVKGSGLFHPIHIHGYNAEIALQIGGSQFVNMTDCELKRLVHSNLTKKSCRPLKDVITVPAPGVVIMQFKANNLGYWLFHCHWGFHGELGMTLALKVGTSAQHPPIPTGFPTCRDFVTNCL